MIFAPNLSIKINLVCIFLISWSWYETLYINDKKFGNKNKVWVIINFYIYQAWADKKIIRKNKLEMLSKSLRFLSVLVFSKNTPLVKMKDKLLFITSNNKKFV